MASPKRNAIDKDVQFLYRAYLDYKDSGGLKRLVSPAYTDPMPAKAFVTNWINRETRYSRIDVLSRGIEKAKLDWVKDG